MNRVSDAAIEVMLASRADRSRAATADLADLIAGTALADLIAGTAQVRSRPTRWIAAGRPAWVAVATVFVIALASALVAGSLRTGPLASMHPSGPLPASGREGSPTQSTPVVGADRWPGGIPTLLGGAPVFVGLDAQRQLATQSDDAELLVGGSWLSGPVICTGGISVGPVDLNPLAFRGCPRYRLEGVPGRFLYPRDVPTNAPIILRVHTHDRRADTCWNVEACRQVVVVDGVAWSARDAAMPAPIDAASAVNRVTAIQFAEQRTTAPNEITYVDEDVFALPIACHDLPELLFEIRGDPRVRLVAVFADPAARAAFQNAAGGSQAIRAIASACLDPVDPPGSDARWIGLDNLLVLSDTDDATAAEILTQLRNTTGTSRNLIPLPAGADLSRETVSDFLAARAAGEWDHAWGERLISPPSDVTYPYGEFQEDTLRRAAANALDGSMTLIAANATQTDVGPTIWSGRPPGSDLWVYRVDYPGATDPALASETFVVIHDPKSGFRDWTMVRLAGADYPYVPVEMPAPLPSGISTPSPIPGSDGTGDTPCVPAPGPCG